MPLGPKDTPRRTADVERFVGKIPGVKTWKLHRDPSGYFYVYGELEGGTPFATQGISVYALHQTKLEMWPGWIMEVVEPEVGGGQRLNPRRRVTGDEPTLLRLRSAILRIMTAFRDDKFSGWDQVLDKTEAAVFRYGLQRIFKRSLGTINSLRREYEGCKMPDDTAFAPAEDILYKAEKLLGIKIR